jgi:hypothetical protein
MRESSCDIGFDARQAPSEGAHVDQQDLAGRVHGLHGPLGRARDMNGWTLVLANAARPRRDDPSGSGSGYS